MGTNFQIRHIGPMEYKAAFSLQLKLHEHRLKDEIPDTLILLEHPHVYTLGRHADDHNLVWNETQRKINGVDLIRVDRGGDVTYHGPGQLVGYVLIKLRERNLTPRLLVEGVENLVIRTLAQCDIEAHIHPAYPGVWVGDAKICAIGMRIKEGVSYHGFALNVSTDLSYFDGIIPCGIRDKKVCSMNSVLGREIDMEEVRQILTCSAGQIFPKL